MRTTGAPKSVTSGATGVPDAGISGCARPVEAVGAIELPSAIPSFIEACAKLAGVAAGRRDVAAAKDLLEKARRVAALRDDHGTR